MMSELTYTLHNLADVFNPKWSTNDDYPCQFIQNSSYTVNYLPPVWSDVQELITCLAISGWVKSIWCGTLWKALVRLRLKTFSKIIFLSTMTPLATSTPSSLAKSLWRSLCSFGIPRATKEKARIELRTGCKILCFKYQNRRYKWYMAT